VWATSGYADDVTDHDQVVEHYEAAQLDALVVIGGDGTMSGAAHLMTRACASSVCPRPSTTIFGPQTSPSATIRQVVTATDALDKVHTTASSHHRVMVVELMGRYAGWLALNAGVASGADVILLPEIPFSLEKVVGTCMGRSRRGRRFTIIAAGEGATPIGGARFVDRLDPNSPDPIRLGGVARFVADNVERMSGLECRSMVLRHIQRGGTPTARDRVLATRFGFAAFEVLMKGRFGEVVVSSRRERSAPCRSQSWRARRAPCRSIMILSARHVPS
jgi:6-phosphofructokinase